MSEDFWEKVGKWLGPIVGIISGMGAGPLLLSAFDSMEISFSEFSSYGWVEWFLVVVMFLAAIPPVWVGFYQGFNEVTFWYDIWRVLILPPVVALLSAVIGLIICFIVYAFAFEGPLIAILFCLIGGAISAPAAKVIAIIFE